jgi:hypothetical protein
MSTINHVPGPWRVYGLAVKWVSHGQWRILAKAGGTGLTIEANMANAKLIAAAPDMIAALERIADMRDTEGNAIEMHRDELRGIARAAIAKAVQS